MPVQEPFVDVVVTVLNAGATIDRCLDALLDLDYPEDRYGIVVVDAESVDRTQEIVRSYGARDRPEIRLFIQAGTIAAGRNEGIRHARGDLVAVTDGDVLVSRQWLRELIKGLDLGERIGAVGGPNDAADDDLASRTVASIPVHGPTRTAVPLLGRSRYGSSFVSDSDWYTNVTRNSLFRGEALDAVGGFAEELITAEDPELNHRLHLAGWRTAYTPAAVVYHVHRKSLRAFYRQMLGYAYGHGRAAADRPYMRRRRHVLPLLAGFVAAVLTVLVPFSAWARLALAVLAAVACASVLAYALRCAIARRDPRLLVTIPVYVAAWQLAWAFHYPRGRLSSSSR